MATAVHIPVSEYLATHYDPDCDYVDGAVLERNVGEQKHALLQNAIGAIFFANRRSWGLRVLTEQRVQTAATHFRIPDVCAVAATDPLTPILQTAPLLCVEVLSSGQSASKMIERAQDYVDMGVRHIWIIDAESRAVWTIEDGVAQQLEGDVLAIAGTAVRLRLREIFEEIDAAPTA